MIKLTLFVLFLSFFNKHTLTLLLTLELLCVLLVVVFILNGSEIYYSLFLICIGACEGVVGLCAIISIARFKQVNV